VKRIFLTHAYNIHETLCPVHITQCGRKVVKGHGTDSFFSGYGTID
jgi:hypothetical protein